MDDKRDSSSNVNSSLRGSKMTTNLNEGKVSDALSFLGVKPDKQLVGQAIGYLSANAMQTSISNVETFLNSKSSVKDLRK